MAYYKRTAGLACGRLLINPGTDNFYQDCVASVTDVIREISSSYRRTLHYGFSAGGYAALRFGSDDPKCVGVYAIAPHFVLDRPATRSSTMMKIVSEDPRDVNIIDRINQFRHSDIHVSLPCYDAMDGAQVQDSFGIKNYLVKLKYLKIDHQIRSSEMPEIVVGHFLAHGAFSVDPDKDVADETDIAESVLTYDLLAAFRNDDRHFNENSLYMKSNNVVFLYWRARYLEKIGRIADALADYTRAIIVASPRKDRLLYGVLLSAANAYVAAGLSTIAFSHYQYARSLYDKEPMSYILEARLWSTMGNAHQIESLIARYEANAGTDTQVDEMKALLKKIT